MISDKLRRSLSHHAPKDEEQVARMEALRGAAKEFGASIELHTKPSREQSLAITSLEQALMWAVKGVVLE